MKKSVLYFAAFILQLTAGNAQVCTPDPQYTQPGIYPDSITNLDTGMVGIPYSDTITAVVPADTVDPSGTCCNPVVVDSMVLTGISGLPPGLSYQCNPPSCGFPGGTSGCVLISGIPTDTGTFNLTANVTAYIVCCPVLFGCGGCTPVTQPGAVNYYTIVIKPPLSASITASTNVDCKGNCNGQATVTAAGGTPPYTYSWSNGDNTATADSLCAGTYTATVTDADSSTVNVSITITEPANALSGTMSGTDETCAGCNDGTAKVVASGGTSPYTYSWNTTPIQTTDSIGGLAPATYTVTVTDANGCTFTGSVIVNPSGCALSSSASGTDETCVGCNDGTITITVSGGTPPYTYILITVDTILTPGTTATFVSLAPGTYSFTVTDSAGCSSAGSATVNAYVCALLTDSISSTDETVAGSKDGTATMAISGGTPPYTYNWGIDSIVTNDTVLIIDSLTPTAYTITVTDAGGCSKTESVTINAGPSGIQPFDDLTNRVLVYPNPADNELTIVTAFKEQVIFAVYDIVGKQIKGVAIEGTTKVNTAELAEGMYIYHILNKQGAMLNRGKFSIAK